MKVLPTARILLIDADADRRETARAGLTALGVGSVTEASSVEEARGLPRQFDVIVVQATAADLVPDHPFKDTGDAIPAVVVTDGAPHILARVASRCGYDAAVGMPLLPRLLYRRIGSVLQRTRRAQRPAPVAADSSARDETAAN